YDWIVPEQRGVQLDFTGYAGIEFADDAHRAIAQVGATWKQLYDGAPAKGHAVPFVPTVPLDFAIGDALYGDAPFASYRGEFASHVNALRTISPFGHRARLGLEEVANNTAMAGFKSKSAEVPNPFDVPADAYRKTADTVVRSLFVGEVRVPAKALGDLSAKIRALGDQSVAKAGVYASLRATGTVST